MKGEEFMSDVHNNEGIKFFRDNRVSIQITLDNNNEPTVHAFIGEKGKIKGLYKTQGVTVDHALNLMKIKYFEIMGELNEKA